MAIGRVKTGIPGMDELVQGGFPEGSCMLISGSPGTGKSTMAVHFLHDGAVNGEVGIYVSFDEPRESILLSGNELGFNLRKLEKEDKLVILEYFTIETSLYLDEGRRLEGELKGLEKKKRDLEKGGMPTNEIESRIDVLRDRVGEVERAIRESRYKISQHEREEMFFGRLNEIIPIVKAKRLVVDSLSAYMIYGVNKDALHMFIHRLRDLGTTTILISEAPEDIKSLEKTAEYLVDGVIELQHLDSGGSPMSMRIKKMRWTNQKKGFIPYQITHRGIVIRDD
jgi:KaiC/GvpD/RAD55 family RecA-like ATPase